MQQHSTQTDGETGAAPSTRKRARRQRQLVLALGALAVVSILASTTLSVWRIHDEVIQLGDENLLSVARILAEQTLRSTHTVNAILHSAAESAQTGAERDSLAPPGALRQQLRQIIAHTPYVSALLASDAGGKLLVDTEQIPPRRIDYDPSQFFRTYRESQQAPEQPPPLLIGRVEGVRSIMVSRGLYAADGAFLGVVTAMVDPAYFLGPFGLPDLGPQGAVRLLRRDGVLLTGYPAALAAATRDYRDSALLTQGTEAERGLIRHVGTAAPGERISAVRAVEGYPLVVTVTSSLSFILRHWYRNAALFVAIAAVTSVFLGLITWSLVRQLRVDEELKSVLVASQERLQAVIQSAMDGIIIADARQRIVLFNAAAEQIFRRPRAEMIGAEIGRIIPGEWLKRQPSYAGASDASGAHLALTGIRAADGEFPIDASVSPVLLDDVDHSVVILRDVTERKRVEAALRESEEQHRTILRTAMDGFWVVDTQGRLREVNETYCRMSGYSAQELLAMTIADLEANEAGGDTAAHMQEIMEKGHDRFESSHRRKDGSVFDVEVGVQYRSIDGGRFVVFVQDITERKHAEQELRHSRQELRSLSKAANEALEAERRSTARELHDELGQSLTALKMDLESLRSALPPEQPELGERTQAMHALLDGTIAATRRIAANLRPLMLDDLGLAAALDWLTQNFSKHTGIASDLVIDDAVAQVPEPIASALYRVTQESLTNVAKHAQASTAEIRLERDGDWVQLLVRDNGRGIGAADQGKRGAFGLLGIRERVTLLGGEVAIKSEPGKGSEVCARIPLGAGDAEAAA